MKCMDQKTEYLLTNKSIDEISEQVAAFLEELNTERQNLLRLRLLVEELLLDWQDRFSPQAGCQVRIGKQFRCPYVRLEVEGDPYNPLDKNTEDYGDYRNRC